MRHHITFRTPQLHNASYLNLVCFSLGPLCKRKSVGGESSFNENICTGTVYEEESLICDVMKMKVLTHSYNKRYFLNEIITLGMFYDSLFKDGQTVQGKHTTSL